MLRKRSVIETVNDELKNMCQIEHSRHRSFNNFITNLLSGLIAYCFKKPAIKYETPILIKLLSFKSTQVINKLRFRTFSKVGLASIVHNLRKMATKVAQKSSYKALSYNLQLITEY